MLIKLLDFPPDVKYEELIRIAGGYINPKDRLRSYRILLAQNLVLSLDIRENNISDDVLYFGVGLPCTGLEVKSMLGRPDARAYLLSRLESKRREWEEQLRSYPSSNDWQVYQDRDKPPLYRIRSSFQPAHRLIKRLEIPTGSDEFYYLFVSPGDRFRKGKKYQNYTVEEFGLSIKRPKFDPELIRIPNPAIPNPLLYKSTPRYWLLDGGERLIQVWRSRVFACPITAIETNVEQPFCAPGTEVKYFEETWHPRRGQNQSIKELQAQKSWTSGDLEEFYRDILRMLGRKVRRSGTYDATEELRKDLDDASSRIATYRSKRGGLETYAAELKIDRKTLARRLRRYGLSLPNPPQPSE